MTLPARFVACRVVVPMILFFALQPFRARSVTDGEVICQEENCFMTNRRGALLAVAAAAFSRLGSLIFRGRQFRQYDVADSSTALAAQPFDVPEESLSTALNRLGQRVYSEEGIPMFLVCENLGSNRTSSERPPAAATSLSEKVAFAFRRYAAEWQRLQPGAPATDVARIVELLAYRDFANGGTEKSL